MGVPPLRRRRLLPFLVSTALASPALGLGMSPPWDPRLGRGCDSARFEGSRAARVFEGAVVLGGK